MFPPDSYPTPTPSFRVPVDPPSTGPFDDPLFQVCINQDWLPFVAGALKQLLLMSTWNYADTAELLTIQGKVFDLISAFGQVSEGCGINTPGILCISGSFVDLDYGFIPAPGSPCAAVYVSGTGWQSCYNSADSRMELDLNRVFDPPTFIRHAKFHFFRTVLAPYSWSVDFFYQGSSVFHADNTVLGGGGDTFDQDVGFQSDVVVISAIALDSSTTEHIDIDDWELCYTGAFPLSKPVVTNFLKLYTLSRDNPLAGPDGDGFYLIDSADDGSGHQVVDLDTLPNHTFNSAGPFGNFDIEFLTGGINYSDWSDNTNTVGGGGGSPPSSSLCLWRVFLDQTGGSPFTVRVRARPC